MTRPKFMHDLGEARIRRAEQPAERTSLTAGQHILHLLLTVFTCGLWAPVWFIRAWRGNPRPDRLS
jgi:hypothetical protein